MALKVFGQKSEASGAIRFGDGTIRCALGPAGMVETKREGDGGTPIGQMAMLTVYYRPDRVARPETGLKTDVILPEMGWCDDPASPAYNRLVSLPFEGSHERMWREDHAYDICVILDWNLKAPTPGAGSAIFFHLAKPDYSPTEGCVAVHYDDMLRILRTCGPESALETVLGDPD